MPGMFTPEQYARKAQKFSNWYANPASAPADMGQRLNRWAGRGLDFRPYQWARPASFMPKGASLSPKGDLGKFRTMEGEKLSKFKKKGKAVMTSPFASKATPQTGVDKRFGPGDKVC